MSLRNELTPVWQRKFHLIEKAGGPPNLPKLKDLSFGKRFSVMINWWAVIAGPIYYVIKGMWKKALSYLALVIGVGVVFGLVAGDSALGNSATYIGPLLFGFKANIDYYKKTVLNDNGWW